VRIFWYSLSQFLVPAFVLCSSFEFYSSSLFFFSYHCWVRLRKVVLASSTEFGQTASPSVSLPSLSEVAANRRVRSALPRRVASCCPAADRRSLHAARPASSFGRPALAPSGLGHPSRRSCAGFCAQVRWGGCSLVQVQSQIVAWRLNWCFFRASFVIYSVAPQDLEQQFSRMFPFLELVMGSH
jgi:hypothetical protein